MTDKKQVVSSEEKLFWSYFMNDKGELEYYKLCEQCKNDCKQSFRINGIMCPMISYGSGLSGHKKISFIN